MGFCKIQLGPYSILYKALVTYNRSCIHVPLDERGLRDY